MKLVPLRVLIGLKGNGQHAYPPFNKLGKQLLDNQNWSTYIDRFGGWHYDKECGHADHDPENGTPSGQWCGMLLVPVAFAEAAAEKWPEQCVILTEEDAEAFYNNRAHAHEDEIHDDTEALQALAAKKQLGVIDEAEVKAALDPDHPARGRRRNKTKSWRGYKKQRGVELEEEYLRNVPKRKRKDS